MALSLMKKFMGDEYLYGDTKLPIYMDDVIQEPTNSYFSKTWKTLCGIFFKIKTVTSNVKETINKDIKAANNLVENIIVLPTKLLE